MNYTEQDEMLFFSQNDEVYALYRAFVSKLLFTFPETKIKVQKTQITFSNRHVFACVSFLRVKKKAELPEKNFILTLGLPMPP